MFEEVIKKILESVDGNFATANYPKFSGEGYRAHKIDVKNFHEIRKSDDNKKIAFVDGGNAEIISAGNFSLSLLRAGFAVYQNNKKIHSKRYDNLVFVNSVSHDNEIYYKVSFFGANNSLNIDNLSFSSFDTTLMSGINRAEIGSVANAVRRFTELKLAKFISDTKLADIIVLDGNLQATMTNEGIYLNELYESCSKNNIILTAVSKTTSLFADNGNLLSAVLNNIAKLQSWYYYPIVDISSHNHKAEIFMAKFHNNSKHIFRLEIFNIQKARAEEIISMVAGNCIDPIFIGYPYGLVEADRIAG